MEFQIRKLMAWNKLTNGELAIMDDSGVWRPYTSHPLVHMMKLDSEFFPDMSKGYRTMQLLLKNGFLLVNAEDY